MVSSIEKSPHQNSESPTDSKVDDLRRMLGDDELPGGDYGWREPTSVVESGDSVDREVVQSEMDTMSSHVGKIAVKAQKLPTKREVVDSPSGSAKLSETTIDDVTIKTVDGGPGSRLVRIEIQNADGDRCMIDTAVTDDGTQILLDGKPVDADDILRIKEAVVHVEHTIDSAVDQKGREPSPDSAKHAKFFFDAMAGNQGARQIMLDTLIGMGAEPKQFHEALARVDSNLLDDMRKLFIDAGPQSRIWQENPDAPSHLGRAAQESRARLIGIIEQVMKA